MYMEVQGKRSEGLIPTDAVTEEDIPKDTPLSMKMALEKPCLMGGAMAFKLYFHKNHKDKLCA